MKTSKEDRDLAREQLKTYLVDCGPKGDCSLLIINLETKSSSSGLNQYFTVRINQPHYEDKRPYIGAWLDRIISEACGIRYDKKRECLVMGGYGYCRANQTMSLLHGVVGHAIRCQYLGFFGDGNWYPSKPEECK